MDVHFSTVTCLVLVLHLFNDAMSGTMEPTTTTYANLTENPPSNSTEHWSNTTGLGPGTSPSNLFQSTTPASSSTSASTTTASMTRQPTNDTDTAMETTVTPTSSHANGTYRDQSPSTPEPTVNTTSAAPTLVYSSSTTTLTAVSTSTPLPPTTSDVPSENKSIEGRDEVPGVPGQKKEQKGGVVLGAIIGTALGISILGLAIYFILKNKKPSEFHHRRLYEEYPGDPVLRLESNMEPLDLRNDGSAYYNPGLQGDNIQMTSFPQGKLA
ncbi:mucin-15 [Lepisosteus oculatus]|uniref:mucin-15 n=1 Tax=Lepisosteus oculatus TaxID=7918 RepID=UPI0035F523F3